MPRLNEIPEIILHHAEAGTWLRFHAPRTVLRTENPEEVLPALREIEALVEKKGWHAAGFLSYEAAPAFDPAFRVVPSRDFPLLWFGLFPPPRVVAGPAGGSYSLFPWKPSISRAAYNRAIATIKREIARGETYQVNYTLRLRSRFSGDPAGLFADIVRSQVPGYSAMVDTGRFVICSASPELFFRLEGERITCRPMKGTVGRGRTPAEDEERAAWLLASEKNRAENVMIVDMVRNDLGRIAENGTVRVPALFTAERYPTLWQMTSTVTARSAAPFSELMAALFPCASITGAPKVRTMGIIADLETTPRRVYTGSIGFLAPGRQAQFNVAIRGVIIDRKSKEAEYGVGGGVLWHSTARGEYEEALLKTSVLTFRRPEFSLLETIRWTPEEGYFLLEKHAARMAASARYFDIPATADGITAWLAESASTFPAHPQRVRLLMDHGGRLSLEHRPLTVEPEPPPLCVALAAEGVDSRDIFLFHKTTHRQVYESALAARPGFDEVILFNEEGQLTEFTVGNLVADLDGRLVTPPVSCGLLPGTFREDLLERGLVTERIICRADLSRCTRLFMVNSVRRWQPAQLI